MSAEAMKQALEALSYVMSHGVAVQQAKDILLEAIEQAERQEPVAWRYKICPPSWTYSDKYPNQEFAGDAWNSWQVQPLYAAPPQRAKQEPVAWMDSDGFPWSKEGVECRTTPDTYTPLYTAPPQREWQGLTDEEIDALDLMPDEPHWDEIESFARSIEAKLKEKNT